MAREEFELKLSGYEALVDALLETPPNEALIKKLMNRLGLDDSLSSVQRISVVFENMNLLLKEKNSEKGPYDLSEYT